MNRQLTIVLLLAGLAACRAEPEPEPAPADGLAPVTDTGVAIDAEPLPAPVPAPPRPAERTDTVMIEGAPQVERLRLVRSPDAFAIPFSTYVPEGLDVEFGAAAGIDRVRFAAAFTGTVDERAFMMVRVYPPGTTRLRSRMRCASSWPAARPAWTRHRPWPRLRGRTGRRASRIVDPSISGIWVR
jgi:hypothetical protein